MTPKKNKKIPVVESEIENEIENDEDFSIDDSPDVPLPMDEDLKTWINSIEGAGDSGYQATLYKYDNARHGCRKEFVHQWDDETPTLHDIGSTFGGGRYYLIVSFPEKVKGQRLVRGYKFRIHENYNAFAGNKNLVPYNGGNNGNGIKDSLNLFREVVSVIVPLLKPNENGLMAQANMSSMNTVNEIIKQSARSQLDTYRELMTAMKSLQDREEVEEEQPDQAAGFLTMIEPLLERYLPLLLGNGANSKAAIETVKRFPQFKQVISNKKELQQLIEYTLKKEGKEKTGILLKKLKVNINALPEKYRKILS
jgi:hypothetical protein